MRMIPRKAMAVLMSAVLAFSLNPVAAFADTYGHGLKTASVGGLTTQVEYVKFNYLLNSPFGDYEPTKQFYKSSASNITQYVFEKGKSLGSQSFDFNGCSLISFKAPKTKKYSFKFSNLKVKGARYAYVSVSKLKKSRAHSVTVKTKGGKTNVLWLKKKSAPSPDRITMEKPLNSRTGIVKLKKGQRIYFWLYAKDYSYGRSFSDYDTITIKVS